MAITQISLSPVTRIEGHLAVHTQAEPFIGADGKQRFRIVSANCEGEMFRGFEQLLQGRDPMDAQQITQRICGVCPISHGITSCRAQEMAYGIKPTPTGRLLRNLIFAANYLQSHILHFYQLSALDFVDVTAILKYEGADRKLHSLKKWAQAAIDRSQKGLESFPAAPLLPRAEGEYIADPALNTSLLLNYMEALDIRRVAHEMAAVFGARLPHSTALVPGGCTQVPTQERVLSYNSRLGRIADFIEEVYIPDVVAVAKAFPQYWEIGKSQGHMLAFGSFENDEAGTPLFQPGAITGGRWESLDIQQITEEVEHSRFSSASGLHPSKGETVPAPQKSGAYSWLKAPRYKGFPMEVGPLARVLVDCQAPKPGLFKPEIDTIVKSLQLPLDKLNSVLGRHLCRALEARLICRQAAQWLGEVEPDSPPAQDFKLPREGSGYGLTEAPRGALGHWIKIEDYKIKSYQCVVPTTWNCSPRGADGQPGPVEKALEGVIVADSAQPLEAGRVVRSFDPCIACAVH